MTRNQPSGGDSVRSPLSHERRHNTAETRAVRDADRVGPDPGGRAPDPGRLAIADNGRAGYPVIWVQALTQSWNGTQLFWPLPHCASGVFQNLSVWK